MYFKMKCVEQFHLIKQGSFLKDCCYVTKIYSSNSVFSHIKLTFDEEKMPLD